jgi:hypothetical protein
VEEAGGAPTQDQRRVCDGFHCAVNWSHARQALEALQPPRARATPLPTPPTSHPPPAPPPPTHTHSNTHARTPLVSPFKHRNATQLPLSPGPAASSLHTFIAATVPQVYWNDDEGTGPGEWWLGTIVQDARGGGCGPRCWFQLSSNHAQRSRQAKLLAAAPASLPPLADAPLRPSVAHCASLLAVCLQGC